MYHHQSIIIGESSNMFNIFKPLYILHAALGISSFKIDGNKITSVGKLQKIFCILACAILTWADMLNYKSLFKDRNGDGQLKNTLDFLCYISYLMCILISWIMAAFMNGQSAVKMILNYFEIDAHLEVFKNLKPPQPLYLKIFFFHILTLLLVFTYAIIGLAVLYRTFARVWPFIFMLIASLMAQKFVTEIYMIIVYIDAIIMKIEVYEETDKSTGAENKPNIKEVSKQLNKMMNLYLKLYENSCIANDIASLPVIKHLNNLTFCSKNPLK